MSVFDDETLPVSSKIEAALELAKTKKTEGFGYLKQVMTREDLSFYNRLYVAEHLYRNGDGAYVKSMLEPLLMQDHILSSDKIRIIKILCEWELIR